MSFVVAATEAVASAAQDLSNIGSTIDAASAVAGASTRGELAAAADDLEAAVLSPAALSELYELVRAAMSQRSSTQEQGRAGGAAHGVSLTLHSRAGVSARVSSHLGTLIFKDTALVLERTVRAGGGRG